MLKLYKIKDYNFRLIMWLLAISSIGVLVVGSASEDLQDKQLYGVLIGAILMIIVSLIDYTWILNFSWILYIVNLVLLLAVDMWGVTSSGAQRWIIIAGIQFQPSELSKIILILFFARFFMDHADEINTFKRIIQALILLAMPLFLIYKQPDLSTSIIIILIFCVLLFIAGLSYKIIGGIIVLCIPTFIIFINYIANKGDSLLEGYQLLRILAWLQPEKYPDIALQQTNSIIAIGSGQLTGKGLNNNVISSVKNGNFVSEPQTDFIFTVVGEELGFIGSCVIIILLILIAWECILIARKAKDLAGTLICCGMATFVAMQSFLNICVVTGLLPNTGIPLPFVSHGLSSIMCLLMGMGLVLNVGLQSKKY